MYWLSPIYFVFTLPAFFLALYAQWRVQSAYSKYSQQPNARGITGAQAAQILMQQARVSGVNIEGIAGQLSDHYDPRSKSLRLSQGVGNGRSVAALGIVAHEVGHAQQDSQGYMPLRFRGMLVPVTNLGTWLGPILFFIGLLLNSIQMAQIGLIAFSIAVVFTAATLPVELNASHRALALLKSTNLVDSREMQGARSVLSAAALTYVAALAQAVSQLLYYGFLMSGMRGRRD
jgi:Zn-dependent membrane protease YugP